MSGRFSFSKMSVSINPFSGFTVSGDCKRKLKADNTMITSFKMFFPFIDQVVVWSWWALFSNMQRILICEGFQSSLRHADVFRQAHSAVLACELRCPDTAAAAVSRSSASSHAVGMMGFIHSSLNTNIVLRWLCFVLKELLWSESSCSVLDLCVKWFTDANMCLCLHTDSAA